MDEDDCDFVYPISLASGLGLTSVSVPRVALGGVTGEKVVPDYRRSYLLHACLFPQVWTVLCSRFCPRSRWNCPAVGK